MVRELCISSIPVPSAGWKARGATGPRAGRWEPKPCGRAREPPCCCRQQLSDQPRTKKPPHHQPTESSCPFEAINEPTALAERAPVPTTKPWPGSSHGNCVLPPNISPACAFGRARALACGSAGPGPAGGCCQSWWGFSAGAPPSTALQQTQDAGGLRRGRFAPPRVTCPLEDAPLTSITSLPSHSTQRTMLAVGTGEDKPPRRDRSWKGLSEAGSRGPRQPSSPLGRPSSACSGAERRRSSRR